MSQSSGDVKPAHSHSKRRKLDVDTAVASGSGDSPGAQATVSLRQLLACKNDYNLLIFLKDKLTQLLENYHTFTIHALNDWIGFIRAVITALTRLEQAHNATSQGQWLFTTQLCAFRGCHSLLVARRCSKQQQAVGSAGGAGVSRDDAVRQKRH